MNEEQPDPTQASPEPAPAESIPPAGDAKEVEEGKAFAILSYALGLIGIPFFLVPLIMRNNDYSLYHAKQCLILAIAGIVMGTLGSILLAVCIGVVILPLAVILFYVLGIIGLINSVQGQQKPLPLIGAWGEEWFKGITKA